MTRAPGNLLIPFRRDRKRDFAHGSGRDLTESKVRQVLLTEGATQRTSGELPWRTAFGAGLPLLRHRRNDDALQELARIYARDALRAWLPSVRLVELAVHVEDSSLFVRIRVQDGQETVTLSAPLWSDT